MRTHTNSSVLYNPTSTMFYASYKLHRYHEYYGSLDLVSWLDGFCGAVYRLPVSASAKAQMRVTSDMIS